MNKNRKQYDYSRFYRGFDASHQPNNRGTDPAEDWQDMLDEQLSNIGRMVDEGVRFGMDRMNEAMKDDFLRQRINRKIGEKLNRMQEKLGVQPRSPEQTAADQRRRAARAAGRDLLQAAYVKRFTGWIYSFFGASFVFFFGVASLMILTNAIVGEISMLPLMLVFTGLSGWMLSRGIARLNFCHFVQDLVALAAQDTRVKTDDLAAVLQKPLDKVKARLTDYTRRNWLNVWLDESRDTIYLDLASWQATRDARQTETVPKAPAEPQPKKPEQKPEAPQTQEDGLAPLRQFVKIIHKQAQTITDDPQAVAELVQMEKTCTAILEWTEKHPESLPELRRLNQQYIPMTGKLLVTYNDLKLHDCDNADHVRQDIAGMLHGLNQGFTALQDKMLEAVAMDVTGDIAALQGMLNLDGLTDSDFAPHTKD